MTELRKAVVALRIISTAPVPVRVQLRSKDGAAIHPEFSVLPGGSHITRRPDGFHDAYCRASRPRIARFMRLEEGFWLDGAFHLLPEKRPETPAAAP